MATLFTTASPASGPSLPALRIPPVPCRDDLATVAERYFRKNKRAVEIGVYKGKFAEHNLQQWSGEYWCVDAWTVRKNETIDNRVRVNFMWYTMDRVKRFGKRVHLVRDMSQHAAEKFPDEYFGAP